MGDPINEGGEGGTPKTTPKDTPGFLSGTLGALFGGGGAPMPSLTGGTSSSESGANSGAVNFGGYTSIGSPITNSSGGGGGSGIGLKEGLLIVAVLWLALRG